MANELEDFSLFELFRMETEEQVRVLQAELLQAESAASPANLESLMRAAHSLKGAARIVGLDPIVHLTHAMEDRFVAAQQGAALHSADIDRLLLATDWLTRIATIPETESGEWLEANAAALETFAASFTELHADARTPIDAVSEAALDGPLSGPPVTSPTNAAAQMISLPPSAPNLDKEVPPSDAFTPSTAPSTRDRERTVRISADRFDRVLALASETLVASRNLTTRNETLERSHRALAAALQLVDDTSVPAETRAAARREIERQAAAFASIIGELDVAARANERTAERIYRTILAGRLRPFSDATGGVARLARDTARELGKQVRLEVLGERTRVDRDILERLESPLTHLLSNAIDHGVEPPAERVAAGKPPEARLRLHARHENGQLVVTVQDDGRGVNADALRKQVVSRGLVTTETAAGLSHRELLEFLFLPGFSTRTAISEVSGRGVGLNVVQSMTQDAGGSVTITSEFGVGTTFRLTLPVTRSVVKVLRVQAAGESYAVPLVRIDRVAHLQPFIRDTMQVIEYNHDHLPVVGLASLLGFSTVPPAPSTELPLLLSGGIAFAVDRFVDEIELPVRRLDARLGKVPGVSAASLDENGLPILILDMDDLTQTAHGRPLNAADAPHHDHLAPHILIVDDSHTVRETIRRILARAGYHVVTAQNGQEAWNLLRLNEYDLLISDVDMPQMNGIELITKLRENPRLGSMPAILLSYKDREEDRHRGLEAGADFYLTKGDFQNNAFLQAVVDLIGEAA
jgi:two-component system sensor histidine kinase and response regulator WspE